MSLASILRSPTPSLRSERRTKSARFALRLLGLAILLASLILNTVATQTFWYHPAYRLTSSAYLPLSLSLLWHLLDLHAMRSGRPLRFWILGIVESLLAAAFVALFVVGMIMIPRPHFWYGLETVERTVLMTWDTGLWLMLGGRGTMRLASVEEEEAEMFGMHAGETTGQGGGQEWDQRKKRTAWG